MDFHKVFFSSSIAKFCSSKSHLERHHKFKCNLFSTLSDFTTICTFIELFHMCFIDAYKSCVHVFTYLRILSQFFFQLQHNSCMESFYTSDSMNSIRYNATSRVLQQTVYDFYLDLTGWTMRTNKLRMLKAFLPSATF